MNRVAVAANGWWDRIPNTVKVGTAIFAIASLSFTFGWHVKRVLAAPVIAEQNRVMLIEGFKRSDSLRLALREDFIVELRAIKEELVKQSGLIIANICTDRHPNDTPRYHACVTEMEK
jgi:hypothetical protein